MHSEVEQTTAVLRECKRRVAEKCAARMDLHFNGSGGGGGSVDETACARDVSSIATRIADDMLRAINGGGVQDRDAPSDADGTGAAADPEHRPATDGSASSNGAAGASPVTAAIWAALERLHSEHGPHELGRALHDVVLRATLQIQRDTNEVDVGADAAALKFVQGGNEGVGGTPTAATDGGDGSNGYTDHAPQLADSTSVQQLLRDGQREHVALHMAAEHELNIAAVLAAEVDAVASELHAELVAQSQGTASSAGASVADAAWSALKLAAETAAIEEALATLSEEASRLQSLADSRQQQQRALKATYRQMQGFRELTAAKHAVIQELLRAQPSSAAGLSQAADVVAHAAAAALIPTGSATVQAASKLRTSVAAEDAAFESFPLDSALLSNVDASARTPVDALSIHRLASAGSICGGGGGSGGGSFNAMAELLGCKSGADNAGDAGGTTVVGVVRHEESGDALLASTVAAKAEASKLELLSAGLNKSVARYDEVASRIAPDLVQRVELEMQEQLEVDSPKLETAVRNAEKMIFEAARGQTFVDEWIEQPAQYLAPTLTRGGLTIDEWHSKVDMLHAARAANAERHAAAAVGGFGASPTRHGNHG